MYRPYYILPVVSLFIFFIGFGVSLAQSTGGTAPLYLNINPTNPRPEDRARASVESYSTDLNSADISWFVNDSIVDRGMGIKTILFTTGKAGSETKVSVVIQTVDGLILEKEVFIKPTSVSLIWEADTYTPPFYKGKALFSHQAVLKVTALPEFIDTNGVPVSPSQLIYKWKRNGTVMNESSGFGKQTLSVKGAVITRPFSINVEITTTDGTLKGNASMVVASTNPTLLLYEESPAYGTRFAKAITDVFNLNKEELTLIAVPYFFSVSYPDELNYSWLLNGTLIDNKNMVTFRNENNQSGTSQLSVKTENVDKFLQFGSQKSTLKFETLNNRSIF